MAATYRSNTRWFVGLLVAFLLGGYAILTYVVAGSESACNGGPGHIEWVWQPVPKFACMVGPRF